MARHTRNRQSVQGFGPLHALRLTRAEAARLIVLEVLVAALRLPHAVHAATAIVAHLLMLLRRRR